MTEKAESGPEGEGVQDGKLTQAARLALHHWLAGVAASVLTVFGVVGYGIYNAAQGMAEKAVREALEPKIEKFETLKTKLDERIDQLTREQQDYRESMSETLRQLKDGLAQTKLQFETSIAEGKAQVASLDVDARTALRDTDALVKRTKELEGYVSLTEKLGSLMNSANVNAKAVAQELAKEGQFAQELKTLVIGQFEQRMNADIAAARARADAAHSRLSNIKLTSAEDSSNPKFDGFVKDERWVGAMGINAGFIGSAEGGLAGDENALDFIWGFYRVKKEDRLSVKFRRLVLTVPN